MRGRSMRKGGFTLIELLVVIAIIAMLVTAILPAIQATRAAARRAQCKSNLLQVVMAAQNFEMAHEYYPSGVKDPQAGPIRNTESGLHQSWTLSLLPYMDEGALHRNLKTELSVYGEANRGVRELSVAGLLCPSRASSDIPKSNYAACHHDVEAPIDADNSGVFFLNSKISSDDVRDGLSHTVFFGEKTSTLDDLGWMSGTRATLRNTGTPINVDPWKSVVLFKRTEKSTTEDMATEEEEAEIEEAQVEEIDESEADPDGDLGSEYGVAAQPDNNATVTIVEDPESPITELSVGGFGSHHGAGAHLSFGDGRIQFMDSAIDPAVLQQLGHRDDGQLLDPMDYRE